ncbi:DUF3592 domain-containing protein [Pleionea sediminis]|uniref:DUF3592 domain-containing protein n=1 Tax=Pleionea sediminis TaxID=2569479 RepID=UPI00118700A8|nr:DUF3592 domain-containing protein [Pleionea sediminis]
MNVRTSMPRTLPLSVKIKLLFGGGLSQSGWFLFGFGMIFFWVFGANADFSEFKFSGPLTRVSGTVIESVELNYEVNERSVYQVYFRFITPEGDELEDFSFSTGRYFKVNTPVRVEYPEGNPRLSRIEGLRRSPFSIWLSLIGLLPLTGVIMVILGIRKGIKASHLLANGILTTGKLTSKEPTNTTINDQRVYKLTFVFKDHNSRTHTVTEKTHQTRQLEDDDEERLVYLRDNPQKAIMFDSLPGSSKFDGANNILPNGFSKTLGSIILPILVLGGNFAYWYMAYYSS